MVLDVYTTDREIELSKDIEVVADNRKAFGMIFHKMQMECPEEVGPLKAKIAICRFEGHKIAVLTQRTVTEKTLMGFCPECGMLGRCFIRIKKK